MTALLVVCGALAREAIAARERRGWDAKILALPSLLHNRPGDIPAAVERRIDEVDGTFDPIIVLYADCGTSGGLDRMLERRGWMGLSGPHCYATYAGEDKFNELMAGETGTFFLTDYLAGSFDHLVLETLGLDRHPELHADYFSRYRRVVYLQQRNDPQLIRKAQMAADALGLPLEIRYTGLKRLEDEIDSLLAQAREGRAKMPQLKVTMESKV